MSDKNRNKLLPLLVAATFIFFAASCSSRQEESKVAPPSAVQTNTNLPANRFSPSANAPANQTAGTTTPSRGFSTGDICTLPQDAVKDSPFTGLGGGTWEKWDDGGGELSYNCTGGRDSVKLEDVTAKISARYSALGDEQSVKVVSATYIALQYGGKIPGEEPLRREYVEFCDGLSRRLYGQSLPDKFRDRLTNESTYSASGSPDEYSERLGKGLLTLTARQEKSDLLRLEVNFFPDEAAYKKFKES